LKLNEYTAHELSEMLKNGEVKAVDLIEDVFSRIDAVEGKVKAFNTLTREKAFKDAEDIDRRRKAQEDLSPLAGIPMALKDNMCTEGIRTTCSSKILENFIPPYDATVTKLFAAAGAVLVGKTNLDEFAMGSSTENSAFQKTANPWDLQRVPGGSSGGSAACVAADEVIFSLGSDTGGSIRQPASMCGVVGMKPTYGAVSRFGLIAFASSLDQIGPLTKDVRDCAMVMNVIGKHDPMDSTSVPYEHPDYTEFLKNDVRGLKIGLPKELFAEGIQPAVKDAVLEAVNVLKELGAETVDVSLPTLDYSLAAYYIIAPAEASSNLARFDGVRYGYREKEAKDMLSMYYESRGKGFGEEVKRRIMLGTYALSSGYYDAYYLKALKVRRLIFEEFERAFARCDVIISPASPTTAFKAGAKTENPLEMYMQDICTIPANLAGIPGISLPCGFAEGLPVGMQILGKAFDEGKLLQVAYTYEQNTEHHKRKPGLE
jgi:aspartyl-tRNA(Asn)/glutamyl-tRNA(Gln) amidotransferase subunit A